MKITDLQNNPRTLIMNYAVHADVVCNVHLITLLINNEISIAVYPGEMFVRFQLD